MIDGRDTGHRTPYIIEALNPGRHSVKVFAEGRVGAAEVTIESGKTAEVSVSFASVEAGGIGELRIAATNAPGAVGYLDGKPIGKLPQLLVDIPSGKHRVRIEHPDFSTSFEDVLVPRGSLVEVSARLHRRSRHQLGVLLFERSFDYECKSVSGPDLGGDERDPCLAEGEEGTEHSVGLQLRYVLRHSRYLGFRATLGFHAIAPLSDRKSLSENGFGFLLALGEELRLPLVGTGAEAPVQMVLAADVEALTYDEGRPHQVAFVGSVGVRAWWLEASLTGGVQASRSFNNTDHGFSAGAGSFRLGAIFGGHWLF